MRIVDLVLNADFFYSVLRVTTPILFAAMAALVSNKAGVMNVGIEGTMSFSALIGVIVSAYTCNAFTGFVAAVLTGIAYSLVLFYAAIILKSHLFLTGTAMNTLATGGTVFLLYVFTGDKGSSASLKSMVLPNIQIPIIHNIPVIGTVLSNQNILTYAAFASVIVLAIFFKSTKLGLRIRAVGENDTAVSTVGVDVLKTKFIALVISGVLSGIGGAFMSMGYVSFYAANMIAGRGFIGFAAEAIGRGRPVGVMIASLLFGMLDALANTLQMTSLPLQFVQMIPYLATIIVFTMYTARIARKRQQN